MKKRGSIVFCSIIILLFAGLFKALAYESMPAFYLATDRTFALNEESYVNMEGPGGDYDFRIYKIKDPVAFFRDTVKERLVTENNNEVISNPVSITKNTWRKFKGQFRDIARNDLQEQFRTDTVNSLSVNFDDISVKDPEAAPGYLKNHELINTFAYNVEGSGWEYRRISIPVDESGVYLVEAVGGSNIGYTVVIKSNINFVIKQSDNQTLIFAAEKDTGLPLEKAYVNILAENGAPLYASRTGRGGTLLYDRKAPSKCLVILNKDEDFSVSDPTFFSSSFYGSGGIRAFLYTERPVYRLGDQVFFKGIVRNFTRDSYKTVSGQGKVEIFNAKDEKTGNDVYVSVSDNGTFNGTIALPSDDYTRLGTYRLALHFNNEKFSTEFGVDAYKKPAYMVAVKSPKQSYRKKDTIRVSIGAKYHYGEPVKEGNVIYRVFRRAKYDYSPVGALPFFEEASEYLGMSGTGANELVLENRGTLDSEGLLEFDIKPEKIDKDYTYTVMASVLSQDSAVDGSGSFSVNRSEFFIRIVRESSVYSPGDEVRIRVELIPYDKTLNDSEREKLVSGRKITAEFLSRKFIMISQETERDKAGSGTSLADKNGTAEFVFKPDKGGHYISVFKAADSSGGETTAESPFWVSARNDSIQFVSKSLSVSSSKDLYAPGDSAEILIVSPVSDGTLFLTIEGSYIYKFEPIKMEGNTYKYSIKIPDELSPNFTFSAVQFANNEIFRNSIRIVAPPVGKFLQVKIRPEKEIFKPGNTAEINLETLTNTGKPEPAEVSVSVVDEAVYQIRNDRNPSINMYFYHPRQNNVLTTYSAAYRYFGYSEEKRLDLAFGGKIIPPLAVLKEEAKRDREKFKDTAFWNGTVMTGQDGKGRVSFMLPDNITSWRVTAVAVTKDTKVGQAKTNFIARKDLTVTPGVPVIMLKGEKQNISANVTNLTQEKQEVNISAAIQGGRIEGKREANIGIEKGKEGRVYFTIIPDESIDNRECIITLSAGSGKLHDSVKLKIPLKAPGIERTESARLMLTKESEASGSIDLPQDIGEAKLSIFATPGSGAALRQSLEYLADYPYGCIEQTMSRFFPVLAAKQAGYVTPWINEHLRDMTLRGTGLIKANQRNDGGFGWFNEGSSDPMMSAYVLWGLSALEKLDGGNDDVSAIKSRLVNFLKRIYKESNFRQFEKNFIMFSLAESGNLQRSLMEKIIADSEGSSVYSRALAVLILDRMNMKKDAEKLLKEIIDENKWTSEPEYVFSGNEYNTWEEDRIEAAAVMLTGAVRLGFPDRVRDDLESVLVNNRNGIAWKNSRDTAMAVMALSESLKDRRKKADSFVYSLTVNSNEIGTYTVRQSDIESGDLKTDFKAGILQSGKNTISIKKRTGEAVVFAMANYFDLTKPLKQKSDGITLNKKFYLMKGSGSGDDLKFSANETGAFNSGDLVMIEIKAELKQGGENYLMAEDYLAPGFRPVSDDSLYFSRDFPKEYLTMESYDDRVVLFASDFGDKTVFRYFVRAELPGRYRILPVKASRMYYPNVTGSSSDYEIEIKN